MLDIKWIRDNPESFDRGMDRRGLPTFSKIILGLDEQWRRAQTTLERLQGDRNNISKQIGAMKSRGLDAGPLPDLVANIKVQQSENEELAANSRRELDKLLTTLPNVPADDVPSGISSDDNQEVRAYGKKPEFSFRPRDHVVLGEGLGQMDFARAAKISGARFVVLKDGIARLERALGQFMLDLHTKEFGYTEIVPPLLVRDEAVFGTGQLPKFENELFSISNFPADSNWMWSTVILTLRESMKADGSDKAIQKYFSNLLENFKVNEPLSQEFITKLPRIDTEKIREQLRNYRFKTQERRWLIPTAEVSLTNLVREEILDEDKLPLRYTALTPCFRSEAGAAGKDTRGMIRQHQFDKVELVSIVHPDQSDAEHERMTQCAEAVLKKLGLAYRVMLLCAGDMGAAAKKTYDIEVWLPSENTYREISSCSNCGDYQARRMEARFKAKGGKGTRFVHTLNGSGLAVGRALIAVMENFQRPDGSILVPEALKPYMGGIEAITGGV